ADTATRSAAAAATGGRLVGAEDPPPAGGIGSAVVDALTGAGRTELSVAHLAVREMPGSGTTDELLAEAGIDADSMAAAARRLLA
ncbi:MAG TPA: transketolase C-terminal domain-containing protein, partial [Streptosporangiaceae bacterium]|nr:transketolase C-terminal domain-containing protein [Streptosporangiaceae bacterium]